MLTSAREGPAPIDDVLITTQFRGSARSEPSTDDDVGAFA